MQVIRSNRSRRSVLRRLKRHLLLKPWVLKVVFLIIRLIVEKALK